MNFWLRLILVIVVLGLIGWGVGQMYRPACPVAIGLLVWIELARDRSSHRRGDTDGHS